MVACTKSLSKWLRKSHYHLITHSLDRQSTLSISSLCHPLSIAAEYRAQVAKYTSRRHISQMLWISQYPCEIVCGECCTKHTYTDYLEWVENRSTTFTGRSTINTLRQSNGVRMSSNKYRLIFIAGHLEKNPAINTARYLSLDIRT